LHFGVLCVGLSDDITEMYCQLRRLVLEYLGITPTPTKQQSPADMDADDAVAAMRPPAYTQQVLRGQSAPVIAARRSWSRPSITDNCEPTRSNVPPAACAVPTKSPPAARSSVVSYLLTA